MRYRRVMAALGGIVKLFSLVLLVPFLASFIWDEDVAGTQLPFATAEVPLTSLVFALTFVFVLTLGYVLEHYGVQELDELREREGYLVVGFAWFLLALLASIPFMLTGVAGFLDALFEGMSGITTTGATVLEFPLEQYPASVLLWRSIIQWVGGIGIVVIFVSIIGRITQGGHKILAMEAPGDTIQRIKPRFTETAKALSRIYFAFSAVLFALYLPLMRFSPVGLTWKQAAYDALAHTFTTMSTGGFSPRTDSLAFYQSSAVLWVAIVFMLLAGGAFPLYWAFFHGRPRRLLSSGEFRFYLGIAVVAALVVAAGLYLAQDRPWGPSPFDALTHGTFQVASFLTTTGYTSTNHDLFPDAARLVLLLLMFTGGMTQSTSGGLKVFRIHMFFKLMRRELQKLLHPHAVATVKLEGHIVPDGVLRRLFAFFFAYVTLFIMGAIIYMHVGLNFVGGLSASASAMGNIGPGFDTVAATFRGLHPIGKVVAILQMWLGRLEIFTVLLLFIPTTYRR